MRSPRRRRLRLWAGVAGVAALALALVWALRPRQQQLVVWTSAPLPGSANRLHARIPASWERILTTVSGPGYTAHTFWPRDWRRHLPSGLGWLPILTFPGEWIVVSGSPASPGSGVPPDRLPTLAREPDDAPGRPVWSLSLTRRSPDGTWDGVLTCYGPDRERLARDFTPVVESLRVGP